MEITAGKWAARKPSNVIMRNGGIIKSQREVTKVTNLSYVIFMLYVNYLLLCANYLLQIIYLKYIARTL